MRSRRVMYRQATRLLVALFLVRLLIPTPAAAAVTSGRTATAAREVPSGIRLLDVSRHIDVNRMNMFTTNYGHFAWDLATGNAGLVWPRGTNQTAVFASGLWLGCRVNGVPRVVVAEYSSECGPGAIQGTVPSDPNDPRYRTYKVARWTGNPADSEHVDRTPAELAADPLLDPLLHHSWSEYLAGAAPFGAPTRTYRLPVTATPDPTDSVDVLGPDVMGDQMLWEVHNDADPALHTNSAGRTTPLGVEIQQTAFAFDRMDGLGDVVFMRFRVLNKGGNTLDDLHVALWSDPDLGAAGDDLVGCDTTRSMGFCYNAVPVDAVYGAPPPAVGYAFLRGAANPITGTPLGMTAFSKYIGGTDPGNFLETFNYMLGLQADGTPVIDPTTLQPTKYFVSGDPVTGTGWLDANPADRRFMITSGPSRMLPGEAQDIWAAIIVGRGPDRLNSVATVRCIADLARTAYQQGFALPPDPAAACSTGTGYEALNCPRPSSYWALECAAAGSGQLTVAQLNSVVAFVNAQSTLFAWPANALDAFCAALNPPHPVDLRRQAKAEFAAFLANYAGGQVDLSLGGGQRIWLNPATFISCPPLEAQTLAELAATADTGLGFTDAHYVNNITDNRRALEGVNAGLPYFNGGAGEGNDFFGSTLNTYDDPDSFKTVKIRFSHTATQKCYRYLRLEKLDGSAPANAGRRYAYSGYYDCNFQVWDVAHNVQLDAAFVERALVTDDNGALAPDTSTTIPSMNRIWAPTDDFVGGREYLFIFSRPYSPTPKDELRLDGEIANGTLPVLYALWARLRSAVDVIDDGDAFEFVWGHPASPGADLLLYDLESQPLSDPVVQQSYSDLTACLSAINAGVGVGSTCSATPVLISVVSADASPDRVTLRWYTDTPGFAADVERRRSGTEWAVVGRVAADGEGSLRFEDTDVTPGARYEYRLAVASGGGVDYLGQTSVEVPRVTVLAFLGARTRSGGSGLAVTFSLATREPARLEVLDVVGRRLFVREYADLGPGSHTLAVGEGVRFPSGVYLVRIAQGPQHVTGKAAIIR